MEAKEETFVHETPKNLTNCKIDVDDDYGSIKDEIEDCYDE
jgi:hypothetical protein